MNYEDGYVANKTNSLISLFFRIWIETGEHERIRKNKLS